MENVNMQEESNHNSETKPQFYIKVVANGPYMLFGEPKMSELFAELDEQGFPTGKGRVSRLRNHVLYVDVEPQKNILIVPESIQNILGIARRKPNMSLY